MKNYLAKNLSYFKSMLNRYLSCVSLKLERINVETDFGFLVSKTLEHSQCDLVIDVGANEGQFGSLLRTRGYKGPIVSFEPLLNAHRALTLTAGRHNDWNVTKPLAIGADVGEANINVSKNSVSSSLLEMHETHAAAETSSGYIGSQTTKVLPLDHFMDIFEPYNNIYLKIDTQGSEMAVLNGARHLLEKVAFIQLEVSFVELYLNQCLYKDINSWMEQNGFSIWSFDRGFTERSTGRSLQADAVYKKDI